MSNLAIRSFASGELAPSLHARTDLARYEVGLRRCRNFLVMRQGGATKRPGTEFLTAVKDSTARVRLVPFVFSVRDVAVLEFGNLYVRFLIGDGVVVNDDGTPYEIVSPYLAADVADLQYVQSADVITIVHPSYPPTELQRHGDRDWRFVPIAFGPDIAPPTSVVTADLFSIVPTGLDASGAVAYAVTAVSASGDESLAGVSNFSTHKPVATFPQQVTATATGAVTYNVYRKDSSAGVYGYIGSGVGTAVSFIDAGLLADPLLQPPISRALFASAGNYPSVVAYYQQRQLFANTTTEPDGVWASRTGHFHNFNVSATVQDDDAVTFRLVSDEVDAVRHILNLGRLILCTEGAEWMIEGDGNGVLTPVAVNARVGAYNGLARLKPVKTDNRVVFVQALGAAIRDLQSNVQFGSYSLQGTDLTLYSSHLFDGFAVVDWAWQQTPLHVLWAVRSDGVLLALTYIPEQELIAWSRHDTLGFIENVCVVPGGSAHWLYVVVRRLINGSYRRYIERMTTTNVAPVFATPETAAQGGVFTPPPPPGPPGPSPTSVLPPTTPSTTDIGTTGATANWVAGNLLAPTRVEVHPQGPSTTDWVAADLAAGIQSHEFSGLTPGLAYEWRAAHILGSTLSSEIGPVAATQFTTLDATQALLAPASAPVLTNTAPASGFTDITVTWPAPSLPTETSRLEMVGPTVDATPDNQPADSAYTLVGSFTGATAIIRIVASGFYWVRVRYERDAFDPSNWAGPAAIAVGVIDQV